ncbi:hypothetical protein BGW38_010888 [Lunasporangiospora selenospora]|uniref:Uncharacterized protein n=1 Tax=Lunasporangiospora selenospora TaxID=979761 RepID=A0A9P6FW47_9FUNG|nr:hypothetical protein BGW38_010888 [Lunasporangiospora selenospora]
MHVLKSICSTRNHYSKSLHNFHPKPKSTMFKYVLVASVFAAVTSAVELLTTCTDSNFGGSCITWHGNVRTCYSVNEYKNSISSAKNHGSVRCVLYATDNCTGSGPIISGPAYNLGDQGYNDRTSTFYCYYN